MAGSKRSAAEDASMHHLRDEMMQVMPIGAGNEVGRSCIIIKYKGRTVMLDCGIHPGYNGVAALPFFDEIDPEEVDLLLISHFHLDHAASLPYFTEKTGFKGRIFATHPTWTVMSMLLRDYVRISDLAENENYLFTEEDLNNCMRKVELIDYHQVLEACGVRFWCYNAGHVLGAAMFMLELGGVHVLYTGDYSMEDDRHLMAAEVPAVSPDVLIVESTFGLKVHPPRAEREARFTGLVEKVVRRGGRCLVPVFALGRAQELLLILDEYWQNHKDLQDVPVYYASHMGTKALRVYQTYINMMNLKIRQRMDVGNPFRFRHIQQWRGGDVNELNRGPCVVMAAPGMLQSGTSRRLFDLWCADARNGVVVPGFAVEGTLAKRVLSEPDEVTGLDGRVRPLQATVEAISFAAHVDYAQNSRFIGEVAPANIILVHGEVNEMAKLKGGLTKQFHHLPPQRRPAVLMPKNCQQVKLEFHRAKLAKVVGRLANTIGQASRTRLQEEAWMDGDDPQEGDLVQGLFVSQDFEDRLMAAEDLEAHTQMKIGRVRQRLHVPFHLAGPGGAAALGEALREVFADVAEDAGAGGAAAAVGETYRTFVILGMVRASVVAAGAAAPADAAAAAPAPPPLRRSALLLEWEGGPAADAAADAAAALALRLQAAPGALLRAARPSCDHRHKGDHQHRADANGAASSSAHKPQETVQQQIVKPEIKDENQVLEEDGNKPSHEQKVPIVAVAPTHMSQNKEGVMIGPGGKNEEQAGVSIETNEVSIGQHHESCSVKQKEDHVELSDDLKENLVAYLKDFYGAVALCSGERAGLFQKECFALNIEDEDHSVLVFFDVYFCTITSLLQFRVFKAERKAMPKSDLDGSVDKTSSPLQEGKLQSCSSNQEEQVQTKEEKQISGSLNQDATQTQPGPVTSKELLKSCASDRQTEVTSSRIVSLDDKKVLMFCDSIGQLLAEVTFDIMPISFLMK